MIEGLGGIELDVELRRGAFTLAAEARLDGPFTGVFGPSGAGKSTLLHCIAGLARPTRGTIRVGGEVLVDTASGTFVPPHRRGIGVVFQDGRLFPHLDVLGNLRYGRRTARGSRPRAGGVRPTGLDEVLELLALGPLVHRRTGDLSGGERQRVALGRALLSSPRLLLLDEPLAALDRPLRAQVLPFLRRVREATGVPMVYVSHDLSELLQQTDRLLLLEGGRTVGSGSLLELVGGGHVVHGDLDNVLALEVARHDAEAGLSLLRAPGGAEIAGVRVDRAPGDAVHVGLRPEDVVLALARVDGVSTRNQLAGTVRRLIDEDRRVLALVDAGVQLLVELTPGAVRELGIAPGRDVVCLFKANALRYLDAVPR